METKFASPDRLDQAHIKAHAKLFIEDRLLTDTLNAIPEMILILNQHRQIVFANKSVLNYLNVPRSEAAIGLRPGECLGCVHSKKMPAGCGTSENCKVCGAVTAILASQSQNEEVCKECQIRIIKGDSMDLRVWAKPYEFQGKKFTFLTLADIGDEKRRRALERIFFHDIMNTAGGVRGFAEFMLEADGEAMDELKQTIYQLSNRLIGEIQSQRQLLAAESNELSVEWFDASAISLLEEAKSVYSQHDVAQGKQIAIDPAAEDAKVLTDIQLLSRILGNMIKNALEAVGKGETITLSSKVIDTQIQYSVHNNSIIPKDTQLQIFNRSFSTKGPGRGLGTYSIKLLSERYLQGKASFKSEKGLGTIFYVTYPIKPKIDKNSLFVNGRVW